MSYVDFEKCQCRMSLSLNISRANYVLIFSYRWHYMEGENSNFLKIQDVVGMGFLEHSP